jgi:nitrite reductase/ring-hydroxylating ferredoxin subunit
MTNWMPVASTDTLTDGQMREINLDGQSLLLARVQGAYYVTQALCPHLAGHLARGKLEGHIATCPRHGSQFDVRDGHNIQWIPKVPRLARTLAQAVKKPTDLQTFPVRVEDGQVWVQLDGE